MRKTFSSRSISSVIAARRASRNCIWGIGGWYSPYRLSLSNRLQLLYVRDLRRGKEVGMVALIQYADTTLIEAELERAIHLKTPPVFQHDHERHKRALPPQVPQEFEHIVHG